MVENIKKMSAITLIYLVVIGFAFCNTESFIYATDLFEGSTVGGESATDKTDLFEGSTVGGGAITDGEKAVETDTASSTDWWGKANTFFNSKSDKITINPLDPLIGILKVAGNAVIIIVTIFLGIKYMYGSVEGKVDVKEGLFTLFVAMLFFYGGTTVYDILVTGNKLTFIGGSAEATISNIYSTVIYFANFLAVGAIIYVGVKYLMSGAEGKAELKGKGVPFFIGMIMTFSTISFLNLILKIMDDVI